MKVYFRYALKEMPLIRVTQESGRRMREKYSGVTAFPVYFWVEDGLIKTWPPVMEETQYILRWRA